MKNFEYTQVAEQAWSAKPNSQNRRQVQKGGVISASVARQMVKKREKAEVERSEQSLSKAQNARKRAH